MTFLTLLLFVSNFAFAGDLGIFIDGLNQKYRIYYQYSQRVIIRDENGGGQTWLYDNLNPENGNEYWAGKDAFGVIEYIDDYTFLWNGRLITHNNMCE